MRLFSPASRTWIGRGLTVIAIALSLVYAHMERRTSRRATAAMQEASRRFSVYLIAEGVEAYRDSTGSLPASLAEINLGEEGIAYRTDGETFRLVALDGARSIVYIEGEDTDRLRNAFRIIETGAVQ